MPTSTNRPARKRAERKSASARWPAGCPASIWLISVWFRMYLTCANAEGEPEPITRNRMRKAAAQMAERVTGACPPNPLIHLISETSHLRVERRLSTSELRAEENCEGSSCPLRARKKQFELLSNNGMS